MRKLIGTLGKYNIYYSEEVKKVLQKSEDNKLYAPILTDVPSVDVALRFMREKEGFIETDGTLQ